MSRFLDKLSYARSLLFTAPLIFLYTGFMGSVSLASSLIDSSGRIQHQCARTWARMILWTCRIRLRVAGLEHIQPGRRYVLCVNHQSHMDTPIVLAALPFQFRFAAKKELFRIPFLGWHLRRSGHIPIDRENPRAAVKSLLEAAGRLREGTPLVIFPEGGTSLDGSIRSFKRGGFMLAAEAVADIVPVTIRGSRRVLPPRTYHVRGGTVDVVLGHAISAGEFPPAEMAARTREQIVSTFYHGQTLDRHSYALSRQD